MGAWICFDGRNQTIKRWVTSRPNVLLKEQLTEQDRVKLVDIRDQQGGREHKQQDVANYKVRAPEGQLDYLHDKLARRLRKYVRAESTIVPLARPPCPIGLVMFEFA
jgi:hypothetical protein